jgi:hypothetical protein
MNTLKLVSAHIERISFTVFYLEFIDISSPLAFSFVCCLLGLLFCHEDGGNLFSLNIGELQLDCTAIHPRRWPSSYSTLGEPQIQHFLSELIALGIARMHYVNNEVS